MSLSGTQWHRPAAAIGRCHTVAEWLGSAGVASGLHAVAIGGAVAGVLTLLVGWFIREVPLRDTRQKPGEETGSETAPNAARPV